MSEIQAQSLEYFLNLPGPGYLVSMSLYYMKFSPHVYFAILGKFYILNHVNFAFWSTTTHVSLAMLFNMSLGKINRLYQRNNNVKIKKTQQLD